MNLDQIATKCFILALFIRDDGQRLLLGDGYYDFNQKLQHFQANTIANDVVEIQGDNGQLLAGQVMRSGAQKFEGYIGDATTSRQIIEQKRSDFMAFFRIKHFYKVIYIFPDGTAIQRQRGYLTDAPTIPEIFQKFPEYSVALNFEDANYYEYAEDDHGDEIYAHIAELALAGEAIGGLIWDAIGAVTNGISWSGIQTAQGEYIQITNELSLESPLASVEMLGKAEQAGTPTPDYPQAISTVTGEQTVKIEGKNLAWTGWAQDFVTRINNSDYANIEQYDGKQCLMILPRAGYGDYDNKYLFKTNFKENTQYTFSFDEYTTDQFTSLAVVYTDGTAEVVLFGSAGYDTWKHVTKTTTANKTVKYMRANWQGGQKYIDIDSFMVEEGTSASSFEPYQGQEFEVNLGKNLLNPTATLQGVWNNANITTTCTFFTPIYTGESFTISNKDTATWRFSAGLTTNPTNNPAGTGSQISAWQTGASYTITAQSDGYLWVQLRKNANTAITPSDIPADVFMVERGSTATSFAPYFTPIELAKIGDYQDRIYKEDSKWYIEKQVGKVVLDGTESTLYATSGTSYAWSGVGTNFVKNVDFLTNYASTTPTSGTRIKIPNNNIYFYDSGYTSLDNLKTALASTNLVVYAPLATPTTTEITNEALIAELEALGASSLFVGVNNIGTETQNAMPTLKIEYYTEYTLDGAGYEWEPGGNTAKTIVTVAGVDSAWPIWTIQGGAQNPTLTNITTGQTISWQGFVPEGQTLTINMAEMTADLAGANVFEYITGEWLRLAPGNNTLVYNAGNADKPSTLSWNGVLA